MLSLRTWLLTGLIICLVSVCLVVCWFSFALQVASIESRLDAQAFELHSVLQANLDQSESMNVDQLKILVDQYFLTGRYSDIHLRGGTAGIDYRLYLSSSTDERVPKWFVHWLDLGGFSDAQLVWMQGVVSELLNLSVSTNAQFDTFDLWRQAYGLFFASLLAIGLSLLGFHYGLNFITQPLFALDDRIKQFAHQSDSVGLRVSQIKEFSQLFDRVNHMSLRFRQLLNKHHRVLQNVREEALLDPLTGFWYLDRFKNLIRSQVKNEEPRLMGSIVSLKLKRYDRLNEHCGYDGGDECLRRVSSYWNRLWRDADQGLVARGLGVNFLVWLPNIMGVKLEAQCQSFIERLKQAVDIKPYVNWLTVQVVIVQTERLTDIELMLNRADVQFSQMDQRSGVVSLCMQSKMPDTSVNWRAFLPQVLVNKELDYYRQPILAPIDGAENKGCNALVYAETLVRVPYEDEFLPGAKVFPMVERYQLSIGFDKLIVSEVLAQLERTSSIPVGVNLSDASVGSESFHEWLWSILDYYQAQCHSLVVELPEAALVNETEFVSQCASELIRGLDIRGVKVVVDNFGQHQRSLALLNSLPLFAIKLSRSFTHSIQHNEQQQCFLSMLLDITSSCQVKVLVEGVENQAQFVWLVRSGVHGFQGFHVAGLMRADRLNTWPSLMPTLMPDDTPKFSFPRPQ